LFFATGSDSDTDDKEVPPGIVTAPPPFTFIITANGGGTDGTGYCGSIASPLVSCLYPSPKNPVPDPPAVAGSLWADITHGHRSAVERHLGQ